jgi:hypothetical protein
LYTLQGFGPVTPVGQRFKGRQKGIAWQWFGTSWGQSLLIRTRAELGMSGEAEDKFVERDKNIADLFDQPSDDAELGTEFEGAAADVACDAEVSVPTLIAQDSDKAPQQVVAIGVLNEDGLIPSKAVVTDIDVLSSEAIKSFDPELIGQHLLLIAEQPNGVALATGYAAIVAKARATRLRHRRG